MDIKRCPFCGALIIPFIDDGRVAEWRKDRWFLHDTHSKNCFLKYRDWFGRFNFGVAVDGKETKSLQEFAEKWNRRANDV